MLGSSIDKPLMDSPLAGGQQTLGGLSFRQPGDMGRYVADNDPGGIAAGFSNLQDFLAAGNKIPEYLNNRVPLQAANPLTEGPVTQGDGMNLFGSTVPFSMLNVTPPSTPVSEQTPLPGIIDPNREARKKADEEFLKTADEFQRGFRESEFYKPGEPMTTDMAEFIYSSPTKGDITMKGSSSSIGQFGKYLESIGKRDLLQRVGNQLSQETGPLQPSPGSLFPFPGMDSTETATVLPETLGGGTPTLITPEREESLRRSIIGNGFYDLNRNLGDSLLDGGINNLPEFGRSPSMFSNTGGLPSILGINPMGQQSSFEQTFNDKQGLDRYVDDLVNERLRDIFGGIMGAINV
jgi:hypothetical protein